MNAIGPGETRPDRSPGVAPGDATSSGSFPVVVSGQPGANLMLPRRQSPSGYRDRWRDLLRAFRAGQIATPLEDAVAVHLNQPCGDACSVLEAGRFDQAPLRNRACGEVVGWVRLADLQQLDESHKAKRALKPLAASAIISREAPINELLPHLVKPGFVFTASGSGIEGFITPTDLDQHAARNHFYLLVAGIEMMASDLVRRGVPESDLIPRIDTTPTFSVEGVGRSLADRYREACEAGLETHAVEYLYLQQLCDIVLERCMGSLPFDQIEALGNDLAVIGQFRHRVMHPTRSMVAAGGARYLLSVARAADRAHETLALLE